MRVAWVHPSWRDLVIGRLAANGPARRAFLRRCGVHGVVLALSTDGGAAGERRLPLLIADEDWDELADRLHRLIPELEAGELIAVLAALREAIAGLSSAAGRETRALARLALERATKLWDSAGAPIHLASLEAWVELGAKLTPQPAPPSLAVTWAELLPLHAPDPLERAEMERFADWLALCELVAEYDFDLLVTFGFGQAQMDLMHDLLDDVEERLDAISGSPDLVIRALELVASLVPGQRSRALHYRSLLSDDSTPRVEDPYPPRYEGERELGEIGLSDVRRVLADL